jgi:hypothetical protein
MLFTTKNTRQTSKKHLINLALGSLTLAISSIATATVLDVTITADNAYTFGFGDENGIAVGDLYGSVTNTTACEIFCASGPEAYQVDSGEHDYVYITAWPDNSSYQGVLANFSSGGEKLSSLSAWEVFATGDLSSSASNTFQLSSINDAIFNANNNLGAANGSIGWVDESGSIGTNGKLAVDSTNSEYVVSPQAGGLTGLFHESDHWLWYDNEATSNPFSYSSAGDAGWVVFRAELSSIEVPEPSSLALIASGLLGLFVMRRKQKFLNQ